MNDLDTDWYGPDSATFGDRVAGAREAADMSQAELARRLGVKKATLIGWEDDISEPRANRLSMLAGLLNVSIKWLLTGEGEGPSAPDELTVGDDFAGVLAELREIRAVMRTNAERTARLEKRLRQLVQDRR
ncbi:multiprotein-bridging factor 1 family protein [Sedimentitalea sp. XS_ASV28]|uniref:helix-turn-helix domain-containing protein n=1 Tax=Sedimentitalea sp. XS_ASV28 TaxID=3241296 RepID=UPI003512CE4C